MFDEFRTQSGEETPREELLPSEEVQEIPLDKPRKTGGNFLGMNALQRFVIVLLLFFMTCILGAFCLIVTERIVLPF